MSKLNQATVAIKRAFGAVVEIKASEFPSRECIEIGSGSSLSFASDSCGVNSGAHNKSAAEVFANYTAGRDAILKAVHDSVKASVEAGSTKPAVL